jgi:hypothetical protein
MSQRALNSITEHPANSEFAPPGAFLHEPIRINLAADVSTKTHSGARAVPISSQEGVI